MRWVLATLAGLAVWLGSEARAFTLEARRREAGAAGEPARAVRAPVEIDPRKTALVVVDMWDRHWCKTYTARVGNMTPRMNQTLAAARKLGIQIVFAPSDVKEFYRDFPQRKAMIAGPSRPEPPAAPFEPPPPPEGLDCCECGPDQPCRNAHVWTRQHPALAIEDADLIADTNNALELFSLCQDRGLDTLVYAGVASNMCVCHRACGMLNARRHGLRAMFLRDLVEAITANGIHPASKQADPNFTPAKGTSRTEHYLEQWVAPSIESRQLLAAAGLSASTADARPHIVFVIADDEYQSERTLPAVAAEHLAGAYRCSFAFAQGSRPPARHQMTGLEALYDADLVVLSMRRRALPVTQMDLLERYLRSGKPLVALRVGVVPFQVEPKDRPDGHVIWRDFDQEVLGCHYGGYNAASRQTGTDVWAVEGAGGHPILEGLEKLRFHSASWLYRQGSLAPSAAVLLMGRWSEREPPEPVAWTNLHEGGRVFYTSLGHWEDFQRPEFVALLRNGVRWALGK